MVLFTRPPLSVLLALFSLQVVGEIHVHEGLGCPVLFTLATTTALLILPQIHALSAVDSGEVDRRRGLAWLGTHRRWATIFATKGIKVRQDVAVARRRIRWLCKRRTFVTGHLRDTIVTLRGESCHLSDLMLEFFLLQNLRCMFDIAQA